MTAVIAKSGDEEIAKDATKEAKKEETTSKSNIVVTEETKEAKTFIDTTNFDTKDTESDKTINVKEVEKVVAAPV